MSSLIAVMLTNTANKEIFDMTNNAIQSLIKSCEYADVILELFIIETQNMDFIKANKFNYFDYKDNRYHMRQLIFNDKNLPFNYNQFLNFGFDSITEFFSEYYLDGSIYAIFNNDIILQEDTIKEVFRIMKTKFNTDSNISSLSVHDKDYELHKNMLSYHRIFHEGYRTSYEVCGWNLFFNKQVLEKVYPFDEQFSFFYQDNDYANILLLNNLKHVLLTTTSIKHLFSQSHKLIEKDKYYDMTDGLQKTYIEKWLKK